MMVMWVIILNAAAILGINVFTVFFLTLAKWWKDFMSLSIAFFFVIISGVLDLSLLAALYPDSIPFILRIQIPALVVLTASAWTLVVSFCYVQFVLRPKKKGANKTDRVDVKIPEM